MGDTFTQIYIQIIFAVRNRKASIHPNWEDELYKYITGIVQNKGQKMLSINGVPDHIHFLIGMRPNCNLSDLVREIKKASTKFITENGFTVSKFYWQEGFGAFSYSHSQLDQVIAYLRNQKEHHSKKSFQEEYIQLLEKFGIDYNHEYLFDWHEK